MIQYSGCIYFFQTIIIIYPPKDICRKEGETAANSKARATIVFAFSMVRSGDRNQVPLPTSLAHHRELRINYPPREYFHLYNALYRKEDPLQNICHVSATVYLSPIAWSVSLPLSLAKSIYTPEKNVRAACSLMQSPAMSMLFLLQFTNVTNNSCCHTQIYSLYLHNAHTCYHFRPRYFLNNA